MDRSIVYAGAGVQDTDLLYAQRSAMVGLGMLAEMVLGNTQLTGPAVTGLSIQPTSPPSMSVIINRGALFGWDTIDATAYGSLGADTAQGVVQSAINLDTVVLPPFTAPASGNGQIFLVQAQASQQDTAPMVLPFWNAANPSQPYLGPNNTGGTVPTQRTRRVALSVKAGTPAALGTQVAPNHDLGWVPIALVTVLAGQTSIITQNVGPHPMMPRPPFALQYLTPGFSRRETFLESTLWIVPVGVTMAKVVVVGGGGGGSSGSATQAGSGGGSGGMAMSIISGLVPGTKMNCVVGLGGLGGASGGASGAIGGSSMFGANMTATSGQPGTFSPGYAAGGQGGVGYNSDEAYAGSYGLDAMLSSNAYGGGGAPGPFGGGGRAAAGANGYDGSAPGAGGGGSYGSNPGTGGKGSSGIIIIEY